MKAPTDFKLESYFAWLHEIGQTHVICPAIDSRPPAKRYVALQHDVDLSMMWAAEMAEAEADLNIRAVYNVQVGCPFYDITGTPDVLHLQRIVDAGHHIGLHYDWRRYDAAGLTVIRGVHRDFHILKALGVQPVVAVPHKPWRNGEMDGPTGLLKSPHRLDEEYISDSARGFRDAAIEVLELPEDRIRLSLHPEWWMAPVDSRVPTIGMARDQAYMRIGNEFADWIDVSDHPGAIEHDAREASNVAR